MAAARASNTISYIINQPVIWILVDKVISDHYYDIELPVQFIYSILFFVRKQNIKKKFV